MKVYLVTEGCYSDYHVIGVTTDESKAKENAERFSADVEEYDTDAFDKIPKGYAPYVCYKDVHDNTFKAYINTFIDHTVYNSFSFDRFGNATIYVVAKDNDHAVKVASELYAQYVWERDLDKHKPKGE